MRLTGFITASKAAANFAYRPPYPGGFFMHDREDFIEPSVEKGTVVATSETS